MNDAADNFSYFYLELKAVIAYLAWVRFKNDKCTEQLRQLWILLRVKFKLIFVQARGRRRFLSSPLLVTEYCTPRVKQSGIWVPD